MHALLMACLLTLAAPQTPQAPPRDTPLPVDREVQLIRSLQAAINGGQAPESTYVELTELLKKNREDAAAEDVVLRRRARFPSSVAAQSAAAQVFNLRGDFDNAIAALRRVAELQPQSAPARHRLAMFFWDKSRSDDKMAPPIKLSYIMQGLDAEEQALAIDPDYLEAMTYKNVLLRMQANLTDDPAQKAQLIADADALRNRVIEIQRQRAPQAPSAASEPPAFAGFEEPFDQAVARLTPVRVGSGVRVPTKLRDVPPRYPVDAMRDRVQGVVIIEAVIDESGAVVNAQIRRSIPMLDTAALDSVRQWVFTPTEINGRPVPVLMTVTLNFTLK